THQNIIYSSSSNSHTSDEDLATYDQTNELYSQKRPKYSSELGDDIYMENNVYEDEDDVVKEPPPLHHDAEGIHSMSQNIGDTSLPNSRQEQAVRRSTARSSWPRKISITVGKFAKRLFVGEKNKGTTQSETLTKCGGIQGDLWTMRFSRLSMLCATSSSSTSTEEIDSDLTWGDDINPKIFNGDEYIHVDGFSYVDESVEEEYYDTSHPKEFEITEHWYDEQQNKQSNADDILQDYEEPQDIAKQPVLHTSTYFVSQRSSSGSQKDLQPARKQSYHESVSEVEEGEYEDDFYEEKPGDHNILILHYRLRRLPEVRDLRSVTNLKDLDENPASASLGERSLLTELKIVGLQQTLPPSKNFAEAITYEKDTNISRGGSVSRPKKSKRTIIHTHHTATTEPSVGQGPKTKKNVKGKSKVESDTDEEKVHVRPIKDGGVDKVIERFNQTIDWVATEIILTHSLEDRVRVIENYQQCIMILIFEKKCLQLSNFATLNQILLGLQSPPVERLRRIWSRVRVTERPLYLSDLVFNAALPSYIEPAPQPPLLFQLPQQPLVNFQKH
ncbi:12489_t:CDS:10, partial [Gigaspora margarita]